MWHTILTTYTKQSIPCGTGRHTLSYPRSFLFSRTSLLLRITVILQGTGSFIQKIHKVYCHQCLTTRFTFHFLSFLPFASLPLLCLWRDIIVGIRLPKQLTKEMLGPHNAVDRLRGSVADRTPGESLGSWLWLTLVTLTDALRLWGVWNWMCVGVCVGGGVIGAISNSNCTCAERYSAPIW